jgi:predicted PurR-regulated permease PerM
MKNSIITKQWVLLILIFLLGGFLLFALREFITSLLSAIVIYIVSQPVMSYLTQKRKIRTSVASVIVILLSVFVILIPLTIIGLSLTSKLSDLIRDPAVIFSAVENIVNYLHNNYGIELITDSSIQQLQSFITRFASDALSAAANMILNIVIMYFILYYMLMQSGRIQDLLNDYFPFTAKLDDSYAAELERQTISNAIAVPVIAVIQGITCYIALIILGYNDAGFWSTMCGLFSFIPFVGTIIIWLPLGISRIIDGDSWQGIVLLIYGFVIISQIDNVFRFIIQKKLADVHPLITVLGVLFGIQWFGITGLIFGPLLISYFLLLLKSYKKEFTDTQNSNFP